uniref:Uncharacterized protein n=1 Tax=Rhizophora mucronata TaxID=61149 RepID=A0A2P2NMZ0_RHIMU
MISVSYPFKTWGLPPNIKVSSASCNS